MDQFVQPSVSNVDVYECDSMEVMVIIQYEGTSTMLVMILAKIIQPMVTMVMIKLSRLDLDFGGDDYDVI